MGVLLEAVAMDGVARGHHHGPGVGGERSLQVTPRITEEDRALFVAQHVQRRHRLPWHELKDAEEVADVLEKEFLIQLPGPRHELMAAIAKLPR